MLKRKTAVPFVALLLLAAACQPPAQDADALSVEAIATITEMTEAFQEAVRAEDWTAASQIYAENAVIMVPNQGIVSGRAGWLEMVGEMQFTVNEYTIEIEDIDARGDLAFARGTFNETLTVGGFPDPIVDDGKFIQIWRRQAGGTWKLTADIWNSNLPLPEAEG